MFGYTMGLVFISVRDLGVLGKEFEHESDVYLCFERRQFSFCSGQIM